MKISDYQVLQRDPDDKARVTLDTGETVTLPVGGPYEVGGAKNVLVGDLWVLAGQSNMEGVGNLVDVEESHPFVHSFQSREEWGRAEEPLHWLGESPRLVHHLLNGQALPETIPPRDPNRDRGAGLGLTFAKTRYERTGVPIGLIPAAHGGTSMDQWNPKRRDEGGASLYGATVERVKAVGGRVAGILWYQGESDASPTEAPLYQQRMTELVQAFRADFHAPDLPFYFVQIAVVVNPFDRDGFWSWNALREAQRTWANTLPNVAMVPAIDLSLDDAIHISTDGLKTLGKRLADVADGVPAVTLRSVKFEPAQSRIRVSFDGVRGGLQAPGRPNGFAIRDLEDAEKMMIYKTVLEGSDVLLYPTAEIVPGQSTLYYGYGFVPYCNITDAAGSAIPAFGPVVIE